MDRVEALKYECAIRYNLTNGIHKEACDMAFAALREQEDRKWISVEERLPEEDTEALAYRSGNIAVEFRWAKCWENDALSNCTVTHWMPLPEPPKGE